MNEITDNSFWRQGLGFRHSFLLVTFLWITGTLIGIVSGKNEVVLPFQPLNLAVAASYVVASVLIFIFFRERPVVRWLGSARTAFAAILFLAAYSAVKGIFPGTTVAGWGFALNILLITANISLAISAHIRTPRPDFLLNHVGCLMVIVFAIFCNSDKIRTDIFVHAGKTSVHGIGADGSIFELPFAVNLRSFDPERFISEVTLITREGKVVETKISVNHPFTLGKWKLYQHSYRDNMSVFQAVLDPWLYHAYSGLMMIIAGTVLLMFRRWKRC